MSAPAEVECGGAPRDLGLDQGAALRDAIRAEAARACGGRLGRALAGLRRTPAERAFARALRRHQPHAHERLEGMARGAGVPLAALLRLLACDAGAVDPARALAPGRAPEALAFAAGGERTGGGALLALDAPPPLAGRLVLRRTRPEAGFAGLEATLPWLPLALAGVNERGLAATWLAGPGVPDPERAAGPPPALLVQECLERLGGVEEAVERCERRAAHGHATLLFADALGGVAGVAFAGTERRVLRPEAGVLALPADAPRSAAVAKRARGVGALRAEDVAALLASGLDESGATIALAAAEGRLLLEPRPAAARGGASLRHEARLPEGTAPS